MAIISEKVNEVSKFIANLTPDPADRFSIASCLVEMYRYEMNKQFVPIPDQQKISEAPTAPSEAK